MGFKPWEKQIAESLNALATGAKKNDDKQDKLRYDLIPVAPMAEVARVYTIGAIKYTARNWEKGLAYSRVCGAMERHLAAWKAGESHDPEDGQHHLSSVVWGALALMEYEHTHPELDDRVVREKKI